MLIFSSAFFMFTLACEVTTEKPEMSLFMPVLQGDCSLACMLRGERLMLFSDN